MIEIGNKNPFGATILDYIIEEAMKKTRVYMTLMKHFTNEGNGSQRFPYLFISHLLE